METIEHNGQTAAETEPAKPRKPRTPADPEAPKQARNIIRINDEAKAVLADLATLNGLRSYTGPTVQQILDEASEVACRRVIELYERLMGKAK